MSLHDIDKGGVRRKLPSPNASDSIVQRYAHGTVQNQNSQEEAEADGLKFLERQIIARQSGFNKAIFGFSGEANKFGLRVAEDGKDVLTASDDELLFNSEQNVFKVVNSGSVTTSGFTATAPGASGYRQTISAVATVNHNLGYVPAVIAYYNDTGANFAIPFTNFNAPSSSLALWLTVYYSVTSTQLTIYINAFLYNFTVDQVFGGGATVKYYLLQETAN